MSEITANTVMDSILFLIAFLRQLIEDLLQLIGQSAPAASTQTPPPIRPPENNRQVVNRRDPNYQTLVGLNDNVFQQQK
ncbi:hypothetical protein AAVH_03342 [Aphelenchoides avenae]|nr:hypothetical protein AAVH_03342 [Aphelenchus avenae]